MPSLSILTKKSPICYTKRRIMDLYFLYLLFTGRLCILKHSEILHFTIILYSEKGFIYERDFKSQQSIF